MRHVRTMLWVALCICGAHPALATEHVPPPELDADTVDRLLGIDGDEPAPVGTERYQGAYWSMQAHLGLAYRLQAERGDLPGPIAGVSLRVSTLLSLLDLQISALTSTYSVGEAAIPIHRFSLGVAAHLHPLLITILGNSTLHYILAGLYGLVGIDLDVTSIDTSGPARLETDLGWTLGAGFDIPLFDPNDGWGLWLGGSYRVKFLTVDSGVEGLSDFDEHIFLLTLGYRNNNMNQLHVPRPPEMDYRDPAVPFE